MSRRPHLLGLVAYVALNAVDLGLTYRLMSVAPECEANPLASACLARHGWTGLTIYKLTLVGVFLAAIAPIIRRRPEVALRIITFGYILLSAVVIYSGCLVCMY